MWDISAGGAEGSLMLEDTLSRSTYLLQLKSTSIEKLAELFPEMVVYPRPLTGVLTIERIEEHQQFIAEFQVHSQVGSAAFIRDYHIRGVCAGEGDWMIEFVVGKRNLTEFYGDTIWVPERVPALSELVKSWSDHKLASELSVSLISNDRDKIVMAEIVRREPSDAYLLELLSRAATNPMTQLNRFRQIVLALNDLDPSRSKTRGFVEANLQSFEGMGRASDEMVHEAYRIVSCSKSMEARAVRYLTEGRFLNAAFSYFSRCSTSTAAFRALETARVPTQFDGLRQDALTAFRARIESKNPHDH